MADCFMASMSAKSLWLEEVTVISWLWKEVFEMTAEVLGITIIIYSRLPYIPQQ